MRMMSALLLLFPLQAELIDRVAVSVGNTVITESEILEQMRVRALLEGTPLKLDGESKRDAADRLIQQTLIRREIETTHYVVPESLSVEPLVTDFRKSRFNNDDAAYRAALRSAGVTHVDDAADLVEHGVFTKDEYRTFQKAEAPPSKRRHKRRKRSRCVRHRSVFRLRSA